jgi:putative lipoprotein
MKSASLSVILMIIIALQGCSAEDHPSETDGGPELKSLSGSVEFDNVGALRAKQSLVVELRDADAGAVLASTQTDSRTRSPFDFTLMYDPKLVRTDRSYEVHAQILAEGDVVYSSMPATDPFLTEALVLRFPQPDLAPEPIRLGKTISLQGFTWYLAEIEGEAVDVAREARPYLEVDSNEDTFSGFSGCNTYRGQYTLNGTTLELGPAAVTRRACQSGAELENAYLAMLEEVGSWRLSDGEMLLGDPARNVLARFVLDPSK